MVQLPGDVQSAKRAALDVLLHNVHGPYDGLPRTAGWGYPEPYTRDMMICALGILVSGNAELIESLRKVLIAIAGNQSPLGHIPSLAHDPEERGASDTTPLFILIATIFSQVVDEPAFCRHAIDKASTWMKYQSIDDRVIVSHLPTTDWRDEQWVLGCGLFVNTIVFGYLELLGEHHRASQLREQLLRLKPGTNQNGWAIPEKPYLCFWSFKIYESDRFDLLGNSIALLCGLVSIVRGQKMIRWIETHCEDLKTQGQLAVDLPPNFFPYIQPGDPDWLPRYEQFNMPGEYHNGGIWPFICGFYIAALVTMGFEDLAAKKLIELTNIVRPARLISAEFGFNEWIKAQDGSVQGQDWQSWSAAMYLYAAYCVEHNCTPFFDTIRNHAWQG